MNLTNLMGRASGLNWYVLGAKVAVALVLLFGAYTYGKHKAELTCERAKTAQAQKDLVTFGSVISTSVSNQASQGAAADAANAQESASIDQAGADLQREIDSVKQSQTNCNLSDNEYNKFNALADKTRRHK